MSIIKLNGISKSYYQDRSWFKKNSGKEFKALSELTFEVNKGETIGLIGKNGAGKSTLLQIISGTLEPTTGSVEVIGKISALLELGVGFNPEFTGRENAYLTGTLLGVSRKELELRIPAIEEFAEIGDFFDKPVKIYSSGMYARLAFAVSINVSADILIIDEVLAVGDYRFSQKCMRFIREFKESGTIFFVSHDISAVMNLCDRVIWLEKGKIMDQGDPKSVCQNYLSEQEIALPIKEQKAKIITPEINIPDVLRNELSVLGFDPSKANTKSTKASITSIKLLSANGEAIGLVEGGKEISLEIEGEVYQDISDLIVGFNFVDRLGQALFGENTRYLNKSFTCEGGTKFRTLFSFDLPFLPEGDYSVTAAIAERVQDQYENLHWINEALIFTSSASHVVKGVLIGLPMNQIEMTKF